VIIEKIGGELLNYLKNVPYIHELMETIEVPKDFINYRDNEPPPERDLF